jgi:hypothetical protein
MLVVNGSNSTPKILLSLLKNSLRWPISLTVKTSSSYKLRKISEAQVLKKPSTGRALLVPKSRLIAYQPSTNSEPAQKIVKQISVAKDLTQDLELTGVSLTCQGSTSALKIAYLVREISCPKSPIIPTAILARSLRLTKASII